MPRKPKTQAPEETARLDDDQLASAVRASAQQIWQAGMGAFAKAQQEGVRGFSKLVKDGTELQKRARKVEEATGTVARAAERASRRGTGSWGKLEQVFEERVARALATIGVPARTEVEELRHRIDELERQVAGLADRQHAQAAKPPAKPVARKAPARKTVGKAPRGSAG
jgi:poly(hydroxyalkanoate) granule-associated protein